MTATIDRSAELVLHPDAQDLLFRSARTANTFTDEPVSDDTLRAVYDLIKYAPTSMNNQPLRMTVVRTPEARERLVSLLAEGNRVKTAGAPVTVILASDVNFHEELPKVFPIFPDAKAMFDGDADGREAQARFNAGLQVGYFILGVRAAGLAAGPMTGFDADAINAAFYPDGQHKVLAVVNIGKPGEGAWFDRLPRLDFDEVAETV